VRNISTVRMMSGRTSKNSSNHFSYERAKHMSSVRNSKKVKTISVRNIKTVRTMSARTISVRNDQSSTNDVSKK
jgi:hypothetical protein